jgi:hypothetical protein
LAYSSIGCRSQSAAWAGCRPKIDPVPEDEISPFRAALPGATSSAGLTPPGTTCFGLRLAGVPVLFPAGEALEYLPEAVVFPLPLAPRRLRGLMQLRGHPIAVFDPRDAAEAAHGERPQVLVIGQAAHAAALVVEQAPRAVALAPLASAGREPADSAVDADAADDPLDQGARARSASFHAALSAPVRDVSGRRWWPVDPSALFAELGGEPAATHAEARKPAPEGAEP